MKFLNLLVSIFFLVNIFSQKNISGIVLNKDNETIFFTHVYFKKSKIGSYSKEDGSFNIIINEKIGFRDTLCLKFSGYNIKTIPINYLGEDIDLGEVLLEDNYKLLEEITIVSPPPVEDIIKFSLKNIKNNYIDESTYLDGFYRETLYENVYYMTKN